MAGQGRAAKWFSKAAALTALLALTACNPPATSSGEEVKRLDELVGLSRETAGATKEAAAGSKSLLDEVRKLSGRVEAMEKAAAASAASRKRTAFYLPMESETVCDNDPSCSNTARSICNRISYPNSVAARYTPGTRPILNSVVCHD